MLTFLTITTFDPGVVFRLRALSTSMTHFIAVAAFHSGRVTRLITLFCNVTFLSTITTGIACIRAIL